MIGVGIVLVIVGIVFLFILVELGQLVGRLVRFLVRQLDRFAPPRVSAVVVVVLLLTLSIALLNGVVVRVGMRVLNNTFAAANDEKDPNTAAPTTPLRSGGPQSLVSWGDIGHQGRVLNAHAVMQFVAFLQSAQNGDCIFHARFFHHERLKTPF